MNGTAVRPSIFTRIYAFLFRFYGPSQLGDYHAPSNPKVVIEQPCSICGHWTSEHVIERSAAINRLRCPAPSQD